MKSLEIYGTNEPEFSMVRQQFEQQMRAMAEHEAQLCVYYRGQIVVDLWAAGPGSAFGADSIVNIFSSGKSLESIAIASLADKGLLKHTDLISSHWPEFTSHGKNELTIADLMRHEAGMPVFDTTINVADLHTENIKSNSVGQMIEQQEPRRDDSGVIKREYHALTRGWIANELFRRVEPSGRTIGEYLRDEICGPLDVDVMVGVDDENWPRVSKLHPLSFGYQFVQSLIPRIFGRRIVHNFFQVFTLFLKILPDFLKSKGLGAPVPIEGMKDLEIFNEREFARGETSSANTHASARGLAKLAAVLAAKGSMEEKEILSERGWQAMHENPVSAMLAGIVTTRFTQGGVDQYGEVANGNSFDRALNAGREGFYGWMGLGGSIFQWHPEKDIGFAFVPTALHSLDVLNERGKYLQNAVLESVGRIENA